MTSKVLRLGLAGLLLLAAGAAQAGSGQSNNQGGKGFFQRLESDLLGPPEPTNQPNVECGDEDATARPGQSQTAPGSAFNPDGKAGTVYAGEQPQNSKNTASVSQYDVACEKVTNKGR